MPTSAGLPMTALVTGASGAVGTAVATHLARRGFNIGLHAYRNPGATERLAAQLPTRSKVVAADVADADQMTAAASEVVDALGPIGVLVTCAGVRVDGLLSAQDPATWARTIEVNLLGTFHACRAVLPDMLKAHAGRIVLLGSPTGPQGRSGQTAYGASKAAITGLVASLSREVGRRQVTVNAISPGFIESEINASLPAEVVEDLRRRIDLGRFATPEDLLGVLDLIVDNGYLTGQVIGVDGGMHL